MSFNPGNGAGNISTSGDVALNNPADGQALQYNASLSKWQNVSLPTNLLVFSRPGTLVVSGGPSRLVMPVNATLLGATASIGTTANADVIIDVNVNGASAFSNANNPPKITAGSNASSESALGVAVTGGSYLSVDVDQVGGAAAPTFIARTDSTSGNVQSVTLTRPSGAAANDIHIASLWMTVGGTVGSNTEPTTVVTVPTNWTRIGSGPVRSVHNASARDMELHVFWWRDDGTQSSWTFTTTTPSSNAYLSVSVVTYRGLVLTGSPIDAQSITAPAASGMSWDSAAITTTVVSDLILNIWATPNAISSAGYPSGEVARTGSNISFAIADKIQATAGSTGTLTLSGSTSPTSRMVAASIGLLADATNAQPGKDLTVVVRYR